MSDKLCPFYGGSECYSVDDYGDVSVACLYKTHGDTWNTRPLEDAANARAEAAEARQVKLHEAIIEGSAKAAIVIHDSLVRSGATEQHSGISVELAQIIAKEIIATYALKGGEE